MSKSYVTLEQHVCPVCGRPHDTGAILLDRQMRNRFDHTTATAWSLCPEHKKLYDDGYIALVAVDEKKSTKEYNGTIKPDGAYRTGEIAHLRFAVFEQIINVPLRRPDGVPHALMFVDPQVVDRLQKMQARA